MQHTTSLTAEVSRQLEEGDLVDHYYWMEGKSVNTVKIDTDWTLDGAKRNTGRFIQDNVLSVKLLLFDEKKTNMLMESIWIFKGKLPEEDIHFTSSLFFKN